jgi:POT family proton-dependent oligopeptide transporter
MMTGASLQAEATGQAAMYWLIGAYLLHTIGELCLSPVSLSFITKLAPLKYASLMMGAYFAATGFGSKVAGLLGEWAQDAGELQIFTGIAIFCILFGLLLWAFLKKLKDLTHGAEDDERELS